jgi:hypothetical protein
MNVAKVLLALLAVWVLLGFIGFIVKGLFWLFILACVAFTVTSIAGGRRSITGRRL